MNKPALLASIFLLGGYFYARSALPAVFSSSSSDAPSLQDAPSTFFDGTDFGRAVDSIEGTALSAVDSIVGAVTPTPNADANTVAFLHAIRLGEGTSDADGYRRLFGGQLVDSMADHPRIRVPFHNPQKPGAGMNDYTTAAGAYQALSGTWDDFIRAVGPRDFSPSSQDEFAVWAIRRRGALTDVRAGRFDAAVAKVAKEWASLPGSPYGQPRVSLAQVRAVYEGAGGTYA